MLVVFQQHKRCFTEEVVGDGTNSWTFF